MTDPWRERLATLAPQVECLGAPLDDIVENRLASGPVVLVPQLRINSWSDALQASAVAAAANDYFIAEWLPADERIKLAILLPPQAPHHAVEEIEKHGSHPQVAAVLLPLLSSLLGEHAYYPLFAAAEKAELPVMIHPTGAEGLYAGAPALAGGYNFTANERRVLMPQLAQATLNSLILQGVFERFSRLRIVFSGFGVGWLPPLLWRMDMDWRRLRIETPWVKKPPSEYAFDRVWMTVDRPEADGLAARTKFAPRLHGRTLYGSHYDGRPAAVGANGSVADHPTVAGSAADAFRPGLALPEPG
jgi:predicted TIM-barrel fold metal-dependent hydrolase